MTLLQKEQQLARLRTLRIVVEEGAVCFSPRVYVETNIKPDSRICFDRMGRK